MSDHEKFVAKLIEIVGGQPAGNLLTIPGVFEPVAEFYNNDVLRELENEQEDDV
jgi:hypothetical protein